MLINNEILNKYAYYVIDYIYNDRHENNDYITSTEFSSNIDVRLDFDIYLGMYSLNEDVTITMYIGPEKISSVDIKKGEFKTGVCIPIFTLTSMYRIRFVSSSETAKLIAFFGKINENEIRTKMNTEEWIHIDETGIFLLRSSLTENEATQLKNLDELKNIERLPKFSLYIDNAYENWCKDQCEKMLNNILEELIEKTWHPSRYIDWCLDNEDKSMLGLTPEA